MRRYYRKNSKTIEGYIERHRFNRKKMSLNKEGKGKFSKTKTPLLANFDLQKIL